MKNALLLIQEYRRLRGLGCERAVAFDLASFYVPLPWRSVSAALAGCVVAGLIVWRLA